MVVSPILDEFDDSELPDGWEISKGRGSYSLTDNPGNLRYTIDAYHTNRDGSGGYAKALWLLRPFSGDQWKLKTEIAYNVRPGSQTNNRTMRFWIRTPGEGWDWTTIAYIFRGAGACDYNPGSNSMALSAGKNNTHIYFPGSTPGNCMRPLPIDRWYFEIERDKDHVTVRASKDGDGSTFEHECEYTFEPGVLGADQVIEIYADGWYGSNNPPGYADFEFIRVTPLAPAIVQAKVNIDPDVLNLKAKGRFTVYIGLPEGYSVEDVDTASIECAGADADETSIKGDTLTAKFKREDLDVNPGDAVEMAVTGKLEDGIPFEGCDTIRVINKGKKQKQVKKKK
jgi:hypothetical protein